MMQIIDFTGAAPAAGLDAQAHLDDGELPEMSPDDEAELEASFRAEWREIHPETDRALPSWPRKRS